MFVKSVMIPKYKSYTIDHDKTVKEALGKLEEHQIDGLPVIDGDSYVGIVTRYGIYENYFKAEQTKEDYLQNTQVKEIATHKEHYLRGDFFGRDFHLLFK